MSMLVLVCIGEGEMASLCGALLDAWCLAHACSAGDPGCGSGVLSLVGTPVLELLSGSALLPASPTKSL